MKRLLFILIAVAVAACAFGQQMTWINPGITNLGLLPKSMLADLTYGLFYDEIDVIALAPAELSNYSGIGLFTAYSNYDFYWNTGFGPAAAATNPFDPASGINYGRYLAGVTLPIQKYRAGAFAGFELFTTSLLDTDNSGAVDSTAYTRTRNSTLDAGGNGTADATTVLDMNANGARMQNQFSVMTGVDLGFMGASVLFNWQSVADTIGATTHYTYTLGTDAAFPTPAANTITNYWGLLGRADAAAPGNAGNINFLRANNQWMVAGQGEIPWTFPITALVAVGGAMNANLPYNYAYTRSWTVTNVPGAAATTDTRTGYTIGGLAAGATGTYFVTDVPADSAVQNVAALTLPAVAASDPANFKDGDFFGRIGGNIDPKFTLSSNISLRARGGVTYTLDLRGQNPATTRALHYTNTVGGTGTFTQTETVSSPSTSLTHQFDLDLGGVFEFTESTKFLVADVGFFFVPTYSFLSTTDGNSVTTTTTTYSESTPATADAAGLTAIGPGVARGTRVDTTTTTNTGASGTTTLTNTFVLPVAVKLNIIPDKLQLIGAYQLSYTYEPTIDWNNQNSTGPATVTTVANAAGTNVYTSPAVVTVAASTGATSSTAVTQNTWNGTPNFMVRWMPLPQLTLDFWGQTLITAIGQPLLNFNLGFFATTVGVNVSFRF